MSDITVCKPEDLMNLSQAARMLGVSRPTVYDMVRRGDLDIIRIAGLSYVDRGDVEALKRRRSGELSQ